MTESLPHKRGWLRIAPGVLRLRSAEPIVHDHKHGHKHHAEKGPAPPPRIRPVFPAVLLAALCAATGAAVLPYARESYALLDAQNDPAALADMFVTRALNPSVVRIEIENALSADEPELAASFVELARDRGVAVDPALAKRVEDANSTPAQALRTARSYYKGVTTGAADDVAGFAGALSRDLSYGDFEDAITEGTHLAKGEPADELVFGLACVGVVATAATIISVGAASPVRAGVTMVKATRRAGRLAGPLVLWARRAVREAVDTAKLETALSRVSITAPAESVTIVRDGIKGAVKLERLEAVTTVMKDVGRIYTKGGAKAALEGLRLSETPEEVARVARLAEKEGTKTGAILKLAGRAAFVLTVVAFHLIGWVFSAIWAVIGFLIAIKSMTERSTERYLRWRKERRARRAAARAALEAREIAHEVEKAEAREAEAQKAREAEAQREVPPAVETVGGV